MAAAARSHLRHADGWDFERTRHAVKMLHVPAGKAAGVISCESLQPTASHEFGQLLLTIRRQAYFNRSTVDGKPLRRNGMVCPSFSQNSG